MTARVTSLPLPRPRLLRTLYLQVQWKMPAPTGIDPRSVRHGQIASGEG